MFCSARFGFSFCFAVVVVAIFILYSLYFFRFVAFASEWNKRRHKHTHTHMFHCLSVCVFCIFISIALGGACSGARCTCLGPALNTHTDAFSAVTVCVFTYISCSSPSSSSSCSSRWNNSPRGRCVNEQFLFMSVRIFIRLYDRKEIDIRRDWER